MSNIYEIYMDLRKNHPWLKKSEEGLLGTQSTTQPGQATERIGGVFGHGGLSDKALEKAGGYVTPPTMQQHPNPEYGIYKGQSQFQQDAAKVGVKSLEITRDITQWGVEKTNQMFDAMFPQWAGKNLDQKDKKKLITNSPKYTDEILRRKGLTSQDGNSLAKWAGVSLEDVQKNWKDKGGFEGLMANPAFTLGLALMQSSAQGKSIGEDVMNNFIKAAGISEHYKDRMTAKTEVIGPPTDEDRGMVERFLKDRKYGGPSNLQKIKGWFTGEDPQGDYERALNAISVEMKEYIAETYKGKRHRVTEADFEAAVNRLINSGEIEKTPGLPGFLSNFRQFHGKITKKKKEFRAEGGPVQAGKPYIVGEKGPEIMIPKTDGDIVSNDDAQVMSMLLASNPQLQNVSKARAESILRSRFPDYFA